MPCSLKKMIRRLSQRCVFQAFEGATAWYLNDQDSLAYANEAPNFGRLTLPVLFLHSAWDQICSTAHSRMADPMREDCLNLTEVTIEARHGLMLEAPAAVNAAIAEWLTARGFQATGS